MNRLFHEYAPYKGDIQGRRNGVLISNDQGEAVSYAMWNLEDRGPMMIEPGIKVYAGMIIGQHTRENDLEVNVLKGKKLTNVRAAGKDEAVRLTTPIRMTLKSRWPISKPTNWSKSRPNRSASARPFLIRMTASAPDVRRNRQPTDLARQMKQQKGGVCPRFFS